ncbi:hypothetical protein XENOCAPTIV_014011, partial [Xenoophorus captivus]
CLCTKCSVQKQQCSSSLPESLLTLVMKVSMSLAGHKALAPLWIWVFSQAASRERFACMCGGDAGFVLFPCPHAHVWPCVGFSLLCRNTRVAVLQHT